MSAKNICYITQEFENVKGNFRAFTPNKLFYLNQDLIDKL